MKFTTSSTNYSHPMTAFNRKHTFTNLEAAVLILLIGLVLIVFLPRLVINNSEVKKSTHLTERELINSQIDLYYQMAGSWPQTMAEKHWSIPKSNLRPSDFFPGKMMTICNKGTLWTINPTSHQVDLQPHKHHE